MRQTVRVIKPVLRKRKNFQSEKVYDGEYPLIIRYCNYGIPKKVVAELQLGYGMKGRVRSK